MDSRYLKKENMAFDRAVRRFQIVLSKHGDDFEIAASELCNRLNELLERKKYHSGGMMTISDLQEIQFLQLKLGLI